MLVPGIVCLTRANLYSNWLHFEAGAVSKNGGLVMNCLLDLAKTDLDWPLKQFQSVEFKKEEMLSMMKSINEQLGDSGLAETPFNSLFETLWPEVARTMQEIIDDSPSASPTIRNTKDLVEELLSLAQENKFQNGANIRWLTEAVEEITDQLNMTGNNMITLPAKPNSVVYPGLF